MMKPLLTEAEALQLNRKQLLDRLVETNAYWERRQRRTHHRPLTEQERRDLAAFGLLMRRYMPLGDMLAQTAAYVRGDTGHDFLLDRVDGSRPRPPRRVRLSRRRGATLPVTAVSCARPGMFGNPFTVAEFGPDAVGLFAQMLFLRQSNPAVGDVRPYPPDETIRERLGYWDLACWCDVPDPDEEDPGRDLCHADVLLRVANGGHPLHPALVVDMARVRAHLGEGR